jgi:phosphatidylglycerophosphate synthase
LIAVYCILKNYYVAAGFFLILKSIIDAIDGELSRVKQTPSYIGRYLDSIFDNLLNFLFFMSICYVTQSSWWVGLVAYACMQLQGTLYNYYYVILRTNTSGGDTTSKIFETTLDRKAYNIISFPNWFMTMISIYGLGFQLLIMAVMLAFGLVDFIIPFFMCYTFFIAVFVSLRKVFINQRKVIE